MYRILHTDDSAADHEVTTWHLAKLEDTFKFEWAESGRQALQMLSRNEYDCMLSDFEMPGMNGLELLSAVREKYPDLPFIFVTGQGNENVAAQALRLGAYDYFTKGGGILAYQQLHNCMLRAINANEYRRRERIAQNARRESDERYRILVESAQDGIVVIQDERILFANNRLCEIIRRDRDSVIGWHYSELFHPHELAKITQRYHHRLSGGNPPVVYESALINSEGDRVEIEISANIITLGGRKADLIIIRDISSRKQEELALVMERQLLLSVQDANPVPSFVIDNDHKIISWNRACEELTGASRSELLGKLSNPKVFYPGQSSDRPLLADAVLDQDGQLVDEYYASKNLTRQITSHGGFAAMDELLLRGKPRLVRFVAVPLLDARGKQIGAIETLYDVTNLNIKTG